MSDPTTKLYNHLTSLGPGPVADCAVIERLLAVCWDDFQGSTDGGMKDCKLLDRMENVQWDPPVLVFVVERHGGTVCGSTRAELQHWAVNLDAKTATITKTGQRQLESMAPRVSIKSFAEEVAQAILDGKEDDRLHCLDENTVKVQASSIFPTGSGYKQTVEGRRKTLYGDVKEILARHGWVVKERRNVFHKKMEPGQSEAQGS